MAELLFEYIIHADETTQIVYVLQYQHSGRIVIDNTITEYISTIYTLIQH